MPRAMPSQLAWAAISAVHWVRARPNTRSNYISCCVTRSSTRITGLIRGDRGEATVVVTWGILAAGADRESLAAQRGFFPVRVGRGPGAFRLLLPQSSVGRGSSE